MPTWLFFCSVVRGWLKVVENSVFNVANVSLQSGALPVKSQFKVYSLAVLGAHWAPRAFKYSRSDQIKTKHLA